MLNNFNYKPLKPREQNKDIKLEPAKITAGPTENVKAKEISWGELFIICMAGILFVFALTARILYEYRTDDYSNTEVTVGSCTFKNNVLIRYDGSETIVDIPTFYEVGGEKFGITQIDQQVFYYNENVEQIIMPNQITQVGIFAFRECHNLKSITLSNSIESLGDSCFWNCYNLENIHLPTSLKKIEPYAFWNTSLKEIDIPESVKDIMLGAFNNCSQLETVYIRSDEVARTWFTEAYQTFSRCPNLTTIYVPANLVDQYKTHELWSLYADKFQAIGGTKNA